MNFFEHQDRARRKTAKLVVLFVISVILILVAVNAAVYGITRLLGGYSRFTRDAAPVLRGDRQYPGQFTTQEPFAPYRVLIATTGVTLLIILGGSAYKTMMLAGGGPAVAQMLGGRPLDRSRPGEDVLQNVVEEMSIASGVPVPQLYVLDHEDGINAFAAGHTTDDAVIGVTRGAIERLNRDEVQGVIAHEFSHIHHGDMRLNLRLIGVLHGILVISVIGYGLLNSLRFMRTSGRRSDKAAGAILVLLLLGGALYVIGSVGVLFGRIIQAAVSRQREFLADASAIQFTRNPAGLVGALKKLGGYSSGSRVTNQHAIEAAHLFFGSGAGFSFTSLLATHPPLDVRIRAIDPTFDGRFDYSPARPSLVEQYSGAAAMPPVGTARWTSVTPRNVAAAIGTLSPQQISFAAGLLAAIPQRLADAAHEPFSARAVVFALLANAEPDVRQRQLALVQQNVEPACYKQLARLLEPVAAMGEGARLPLLDLAVAQLRQLSPPQAARFKAIVRAMVEADGRVTLFEYTLHRIIDKQLAPPDASKRQPILYSAIAAIRNEASVLLSALAAASTAQTDRAFAAGAAVLDPDNPPPMAVVGGLAAIDGALRKLAGCSPAVKKRLIDAAVRTVAVDGEVNVAEAELLRATAAALDVPLPPMIAPVS